MANIHDVIAAFTEGKRATANGNIRSEPSWHNGHLALYSYNKLLAYYEPEHQYPDQLGAVIMWADDPKALKVTVTTVRHVSTALFYAERTNHWMPWSARS